LDPLILPLTVVIIFTVVSGYFALIETALSESLHGRIEKIAESGNLDAQAALLMLESPAIPLLIAKAGATVAGIFSGLCAIPLSKIILQQINFFEQAQIVSILISVAVVIFFMIVFGEFLPVRAAQQSPEKVLLEHFKTFNFIVKIFSPPIKLLSKITEGVMMIFGMNAETSDIVTEDEVKDLIEQGTEDGTFEKSERAMVDKIFQLSDETANSLMTPRTQMVWLDILDSLEQNLKIIRENAQNVFPVGEGSLDECRGVIYAKDLLDAVLNKKTDEEINLTAVIKKPLFIPRTMETFRLVERFKATGDSVAIVNDEYGGVVGFITLDDIAQEIVGLEEAQEPQFSLKKDNNWLVDGLYDIDNFKRRFNIETLPDEERDHFQTMGGFLTSLFGYIPKVGEFREWNNFKFRVERMDGARIDKIFVTRNA
jgi:putative hemolysin